jgi:phosphoglucosamine mutase
VGNKKYFGTDGIRGLVGNPPVTAEFMLRLGWAAGKVFSKNGRGHILIGKDTRVSGYMFESALEAGLVSAGVDVSLLGPMPTPAIAYLTRTFNASAGIVISASHNPYQDNGVKFFSKDGEKLDDAIEIAIEAELDSAMQMVSSDQIGKVARINDAAGRYIEFCKSCFPAQLNLHGLKIVLDCAHGATYHIAPNVFRELGAEVVELGTSPDGFNINEEGGSTKPENIRQTVIREKAHLGVALDGDGDRVIMVDESGEVVDGDELLFIIAAAKKRTGRLNGGVVGTQMSNFGLEEALLAREIPFFRAAVGDRYVLTELLSRGWTLGGESSGHILCLDLTTTGDGVISALQIVAAMLESEVGLNALKTQMKKYPQHMINVQCQRGVDLSTAPVAKAVASIEERLKGRGRVLLRPSGTEPVVRVMVEGEDSGLVEALTRELADVVSKELG